MTSEERRAGRRRRRETARAEKKRQSRAAFDNYDKVFSYGNLYQAYKKSRRGVAWKASVQKYITQAPLNVRNTYDQLHKGTFKSRGFYEFDLLERGKQRHIKSVHISERVVYGTLCDYSLVPMLSRTFIYDNGASLVGKGYHFSMKRFETHLRQHYRKYGTEGYILIFDFSKFFDNVSHEVLHNILEKEYSDARIKGLVRYLVEMFGERGLGLGSPVSQILALASANRLDHFIKEVLGIKEYGRYMDDGYLIHQSKAYLRKCLDKMRVLCRELGICLNERKTHIIKLTHGFTYLKARTKLLPSGKIVRKMCKTSVARERRKIKRFSRLLERGLVSADDVEMSFQSWKAYAKRFASGIAIANMDRLYNMLFRTAGKKPAVFCCH